MLHFKTITVYINKFHLHKKELKITGKYLFDEDYFQLV